MKDRSKQLMKAWAKTIIDAFLGTLDYRGRSSIGQFFGPFLAFLIIFLAMLCLLGIVPALIAGAVACPVMLPLCVRRLNDTGRRGMAVILFYLAYTGAAGLFTHASIRLSLGNFLAFDFSLVTLVPLFVSTVLVIFWAIATLHMFNLMFYRTKGGSRWD